MPLFRKILRSRLWAPTWKGERIVVNSHPPHRGVSVQISAPGNFCELPHARAELASQHYEYLHTPTRARGFSPPPGCEAPYVPVRSSLLTAARQLLIIKTTSRVSISADESRTELSRIATRYSRALTKSVVNSELVSISQRRTGR